IGPATIELAEISTDKRFTREADFVLLLTGYEVDGTLMQNSGLNLDSTTKAPQHNPDTMETNVPGIFVAGTAAQGTRERRALFIENCHEHSKKIARGIADKKT